MRYTRRFVLMSLFGISNFGLFCLAVLLLNATPGPDTAYIVARSIAQGRTAGLVSALGISLGCCVHALACALGLSAILAASATAFMLIKLAGGVYLVYLGILLLHTQPERPSAAQVRDVRTLKTVFWQATVTNVLNPKVILFFLAFIPQFVQAASGQKAAAFLLLGLVFSAISLCWNSSTAILAGTLARRTSRSPHLKRWLERLVSTTFIALGAKLALSRN